MKKLRETCSIHLFLFTIVFFCVSTTGNAGAAIPNSSFGEMVDGVSEMLADGARTAVKSAKSGLELLDEHLVREKGKTEPGNTGDEHSLEDEEKEDEEKKTAETREGRTVRVRTVFYISTALFLLVLVAGFLTFEPLVLVFAGFLGAVSVVLKIFV